MGEVVFEICAVEAFRVGKMSGMREGEKNEKEDEAKGVRGVDS
jgi:hypothetical protein